MIENHIQAGLIEPAALLAFLEDAETLSLKILDATLPPPGSPVTPIKDFHEKRIPGALFFDIDAASDQGSSLPHMLPSPEAFEAYAAGLGLSNDDLIVVYGQDGLVMGPARAWWMFRVFGHDKVIVLNGGLPAWLDAWYPVDMAPPRLSAPVPQRFKAKFRPDWIADRIQIENGLKSGEMLLLDARPGLRFDGEALEPRPGLFSGHIPGSFNVPALALIDQDTHKLKSLEELGAIAAQLGLEKNRPITATCGSGVTSCVIALALFQLGYDNISVYDGSWAEWGRIGDERPVASLYSPPKTS